MNNILTIMKKELARVFKDRRLVFTTIVMPGLLLFVMYSFMGEAFKNIATPKKDQPYSIAISNNINVESNEFISSLNALNLDYNVKLFDLEQLEEYKDKILSEEVDYVIVFDDEFFNKLDGSMIPNVNTYYNPSSDKSNELNSIINNVLHDIENNHFISTFGNLDMFTVNLTNNSEIFDEEKLKGKIISMMLPLLIIIFLFSGAMSVAPESIAGEKERGTIATLLVTPIKRSEIALGKILSLSIISVLSALSSFIGIIASLPKLMGFENNSDFSKIYGFSDYLIIFAVLVTTVLVIIGLISIVSAFAKNIKEASTLILPLYLLSMGIGILTMFSTSATSNPFLYLIPIYGSLQNLVAVFSFDFNSIHFIITIVSNIVYTILFIYLLSKMFNSEKVMFSK